MKRNEIGDDILSGCFDFLLILSGSCLYFDMQSVFV